MIRIDLTTSSVSVEGDGMDEKFITIRALQEGGVLANAKRLETGILIEESVRNRSGLRLLLEYDLEEPGDYELLSGHRDSKQQRRFVLRIEHKDHGVLRISVLPESTSCPWVIEDNLHHFKGDETLLFDLLPSSCAIGEGCIHVESTTTGVQFHKPTAWEMILNDDSV
jgi:hypothetical protein